MPNLFAASPAIKPLFQKLKHSKRKDIIDQIPDTEEYRSVKSTMTDLNSKLVSYQEALSTPSKVASADASNQLYYQQIVDQYNQLQDWQQMLHDVETVKTYMESVNGGLTDFSELYSENIDNQYNEKEYDVNTYLLSAIYIYDSEIAIKKQILAFQIEIMAIIDAWIHFVDARINDNATIVSDVDDIYATNQRKSTMDYLYVLEMGQWKTFLSWTTSIELIILLLLLCFYYRRQIASFFTSR